MTPLINALYGFAYLKGRIKHLPILVALTLILSGCAVGPDFISPSQSSSADSPAAQKYREQATPSGIQWQKTLLEKSDKSETSENNNTKDPSADQSINATWWKSFNNATINHWVDKALVRSPTAKAAFAALEQVQAIAVQGQANNYPQVDLKVASTRQQAKINPLNDASPTTIYNLHNAGVNVSYIFDVFGGVRRANEYRQAQLTSQQWETLGALNTLAANVVTAIINLAATHEQIRTQTRMLTLQKQQLDKAEKQRLIGSINESDLLQIRSQVASAEVSLPTLYKQKHGLENQLSVLCGDYPSANAIEAIFFDDLTLPKNIPLWLPSDLVRRRADIQASEASLHMAYANAGMAYANDYPQIGIAGTLSSSALASANLFKTSLWSMSVSITQSLFHGGANEAQKAQADAGIALAQAKYQMVVQNAFANVSNTLKAVETDTALMLSLQKAHDHAQSYYHLAQKRFDMGSISVFELMNAEKSYLQTQINHIQTKANQLANMVALYQAAGGTIHIENYHKPSF